MIKTRIHTRIGFYHYNNATLSLEQVYYFALDAEMRRKWRGSSSLLQSSTSYKTPWKVRNAGLLVELGYIHVLFKCIHYLIFQSLHFIQSVPNSLRWITSGWHYGTAVQKYWNTKEFYFPTSCILLKEIKDQITSVIATDRMKTPYLTFKERRR